MNKERKTSLKKLIKSRESKDLPLLPLVHTTTNYRFREIRPGDELIPIYCKEFNKELVYLFYGRPAYKAKDSRNSSLEFDWPVVFIFQPEKVGEIEHIYPFDTGAFKQNVYDDFFDPTTKLDEFRLPGEIRNAAILADLFYSSTSAYLSARTDRNLEIEADDFEMQGIQALNRIPSELEDRNKRVRDERSSTIELQVGEPINLKNNLLALILPQRTAELPTAVDAIARWNPKYLRFYEPVQGLSSESMYGDVYGKVREIYQELGLIS